MARARLSSDREHEYALLRFASLREYVLATEDAVRLVEPAKTEWVEICCEKCGHWTREVYPRPGDQVAAGAVWHCRSCARP